MIKGSANSFVQEAHRETANVKNIKNLAKENWKECGQIPAKLFQLFEWAYELESAKWQI